jgi:hypothetical protein
MAEGVAHIHGSRLKTGDVRLCARQMLGHRDDCGDDGDERDTQCQGIRAKLVKNEIGL